MQNLSDLIRHRGINVCVGLILAGLWFVFAYRHYAAYLSTPHPIFLIFVFSETLQAIFFLIRSTPRSVSMDPFDWMVAAGGTFTALLLRPDGVLLWSGGEALVIVGMIGQILGLLSLNRSFAIIAAIRRIKTCGLYAVIRHPMYASYVFLYTGYLLFSASLWNLALYAAIMIFLFLRIEREERHLAHDAEYKAYMEKVRYRLFPGIY